MTARTARAEPTARPSALPGGTDAVQPRTPDAQSPPPPPCPADGVPDGAPARPRGSWGAVRGRLGAVAGAGVLGVLLWRLGTGVFLDGLRRIDAGTLLAAVGIGAVTTVCSAWRWQLVARGLRIRLLLAPAVADYYRALFLNAALPGGVLGDVHRAVRHGRRAGDVGRGVRSVVLERAAGQVALAVLGTVVLFTLPSPVPHGVRDFAPPLVLAAVGGCAVVLAVRMNRVGSRRRGAPRLLLAEAREALLSRATWPGIALSSVVVLAGHLAMFLVAARVAGSTAPVRVLLPLAVLALLAMGLPLNIGGFGPREGVTAWAFGAAGLGTDDGLATAAVYGVLGLAAGLPGLAVLIVRRRPGFQPRRRAVEPPPADAVFPSPSVAHALPDPAAGPVPPAGSAPPAVPAPAPGIPPASPVSRAKYSAKDSARLISRFFPFSADPREGRPMTPDSV